MGPAGTPAPTEDYSERLADTVANIEETDDIHEQNKELILDYKRDQKLNGLTDATLLRNLSRLRVLAEHADKPFEDMDRADVKNLVAWIHDQDYTEETRYTYKNVIRTFWKWLDSTDDGDALAQVSWITMNPPNGNGDTLPKDLLTKEDVQAQADAANNPRDKALIWLLRETGARIGELIDLTVGDIEDRKHGKKITIKGKTGARRVPLVESVPHINNWLNKHPNPEKDAPLWCKIQQGGPTEHLNPHDVDDIRDVHGIGPAYAEKLEATGIETGADLVQHSADELGEITGVRPETAGKWLQQFNSDSTLTEDIQLGYRYIREKILKATMDRAGIDKPSNPHHYRHSRASHLANEMTEAQLCEWFGWVQGSDVPARYAHLSGRDIDNMYDQLRGLSEPEDEEDEPDVIECPRCSKLNEPGATFCMRCGFGLDQETAEEIEHEVDTKAKESYKQVDPENTDAQEKIEQVDALPDDPEVKALLAEKLN